MEDQEGKRCRLGEPADAFFFLLRKAVGRVQMGKRKMLFLTGMVAWGLAGCSRAPETLAGTAWKITGLTSPDGTQYDEAAYDAIIGGTVYAFDDQGNMNCSIDGETAGSYSYVYEEGNIEISSEELRCSGSVKQETMKLQLGEQGEAVLTRQKEK